MYKIAKSLILFVFFAFITQAFSFEQTGKGATVSIFLKDPQEFKNMQEELGRMKTDYSSNKNLDDLLKQANIIAEMNDRCGTISITEELDEECQRFYEIDLPAFENKYMELTGEIRLGSMKMATNLEERTAQLGACTDALLQILTSREQLYRLTGGVDLEPIDDRGSFDATYSFQLSLDSARMLLQARLAKMWMEKCGEIVLRKTGDEFAPYFENQINKKNDSLEAIGSNLIIVLKREDLSFFVGMRKDLKGTYYLNGVNLFSETIKDGKNGHLYVNLKKRKVGLPLGKDGVVNSYSGRKVFDRVHKDMFGRWIWDESKKQEIAAQPVVEAPFVQEPMHQEPQEDVSSSELNEASNPEQANVWTNAYDELDGKESVNISTTPPKPRTTMAKSFRWVPIILSGATLLAGSATAIFFEQKAKKELDEAKLDKQAGILANTYQRHYDDAGSYQTKRNIGIGVAILGAIGLGVSFAF